MLQRKIVSLFAVFLAFLGTAGAGERPHQDDPAVSDLPRVVVVGDSIRLSYAPAVVDRLAGKAVVVSPEANGGDSSNVLGHLDQWVIRQKPAVVHFNCDQRPACHSLSFTAQIGRSDWQRWRAPSASGKRTARQNRRRLYWLAFAARTTIDQDTTLLPAASKRWREFIT